MAPYAFQLSNGVPISLDWGCLGFLRNHQPPEVEFCTGRDGYVTGVRPTDALRRRYGVIKPKIVREFTVPELCRRGQAPAMAYLAGAVALGEERLTYGQVAAHLNTVLKLANVTHHHVGDVVDAMMRRVLEVDARAPLLNVMVVRSDARQPGDGADVYLKARYHLEDIRPGERPKLVRRALNEVRSFSDWPGLYKKVYGTPPPERPSNLDQFDDDGQADNPRYASKLGGLESDEHKRLKAYVCSSPHELGLKLVDPKAKIERPLHSGDRMDVEIIDGVRWIAVEVKSIRSGDDDLRRGIYQCVKYKAVMEAQSSLSGVAECDALLVTERPLPSGLLAIARHLGVRHRVIKVN